MSIKSIKTGFTGISALAGNDQWFGDFEAIASTTLSTASASVSFSSIPATYTHLQIRSLQRAVNNVGGDHSYLRVNSDTGTNYVYHRLSGSGAAASAGWPGSADSLMRYGYNTADGSYSADRFGAAVMDVLDYANVNKYKTFRFLTGADNNGSGYVNLESGLWMSTSAITQIDLYPYSGNWAANTSFALYGIRG